MATGGRTIKSNNLVLREAGLRKSLSSGAPNMLLRTCDAAAYGGPRPPDCVFSGSEGLDHAEGPPKCFVISTGGCLSEGNGHDEPGVCLGDGKTEAEGVPSQGGGGDALLRRVAPP